MKNYVAYHVHTDLSNGITNIDSVTKFTAYVDKAKECGMTALGFAEHGSVFEWIHKKLAIEEAGMKYIHACEFYMTETLEEKINDNYHVVLIARNEQGKNELNKLSSISFNRSNGQFYGKPRITIDELLNTTDNIIVTSACLGGALNSDEPIAKDRFLNFLINNKHRCFLEIQHHNCEEQRAYNVELAMMSMKFGIPLIAGTDTHNLDQRHAKGRLLLQKSKNISFPNEKDFDLNFLTYDELCEAYEKQGALPPATYLKAIENTNVMAEMIEPFKLDCSYKYPKLYNDSEKVFKQHIYEGLKNRGIDQYPNYNTYIDRIKEEIETFKHNGAIDFMLLDEDYKKHCREVGIGYGPARGSASGSVVAYCLHITDVDSVKEHLNFSRFMNTERVSLADIDTDFYEKDIPAVKEYLYNKKGLYCSDIITFNTIALKGSIRDVCRGLYKNDSNINYLKLASEIISLAEEDEAAAREKYPEVFEYVDILKGVIVSVGNHPAGVIVSPFPLDDYIGTFTSSTDPFPISQINMKEVEYLNFVKLDLLKLDTMGVINQACDLAGIERLTPNNTPDDPKVWESIKNDTTCIFQWESKSASAYIKQLLSKETIDRIKEVNPDVSLIDLLSVGNGAIRPGGNSYRDQLAKGIFKDNGHKAINELLKPTLGFCVYQEEVINFLHTFCGYTMGQADIVRRGFAKKTGTEKFIPDIRKGFAETMKNEYGISEDESEKLITDFIAVVKDASDYLFSENHAKPYSWIGYICGYLRYYHPLEFFTAALNVYVDKPEKTVAITDYLKRNNIALKGVKFRKSKSDYFFDNKEKAIYKGLGSIKSMSKNVGDLLYQLKDREYRNFAEFLFDTKEIGVTESSIESLIYLDYFSEFGKADYLLAVLNYYKTYKKRSTLNRKELSDDMCRVADKCSQKITPKMYKEIDIKEYIIQTCDFISVPPITLVKILNKQHDLLGYIEYKNEKYDKIARVMETNLRYSPQITIYSLSKGTTSVIKISKKIFDLNPLGVGDIIKIADFKKKSKTKFVDGAYVPSEGYDWWVYKYAKVNISD